MAFLLGQQAQSSSALEKALSLAVVRASNVKLLAYLRDDRSFHAALDPRIPSGWWEAAWGLHLGDRATVLKSHRLRMYSV